MNGGTTQDEDNEGSKRSTYDATTRSMWVGWGGVGHYVVYLLCSQWQCAGVLHRGFPSFFFFFCCCCSFRPSCSPYNHLLGDHLYSSLCREVMMEVTAVFLSSVDSPDKLLKGAGALAKMAYGLSNAKSLEFADATSDARSLLRLLAWLSNLQIVMRMENKNLCGVRDVLYLARVIAEGAFKLCDNVAFVAKKAQGDTPLAGRFMHVSRQCLFWSYLSALLISLFDLWCDARFGGRKRRSISSFQILCDFLTAASGARFAGFELSRFWNLLLTLVSAVFGCVEGYRAAAIKVKTGTVGI